MAGIADIKGRIMNMLLAYLKPRKFKTFARTFSENGIVNREGAAEISFTNTGETVQVGDWTLGTNGVLVIEANENEKCVDEHYTIFWPPAATNRNLVVSYKQIIE